MKSYGHNSNAPVDCCPGHTKWACQSKHNGSGPRFNRAASRRPWKKAERRRVKQEIALAMDEE